MVPLQVSFVERSSLSQRVPYRRFHCNTHTNQEKTGVGGGGGRSTEREQEEGEGETDHEGG